MPKHYTLAQLDEAADLLCKGGVLAYPTEAVFGLGCDPHNQTAFERIFTLKQRPSNQGVLLIAADFAQIEHYVDMAKVPPGVLAQVRASWPGPFTWVFPRSTEVPDWVTGAHSGIALRVSGHAPTVAVCRAFGGALVSTSANLHGKPPARDLATLAHYFGEALDGIVDAPLGGATQPSTIRDALTGAFIRS
ncbi:tRNA threonylcarbamoyladenosine biosynthesis protein RimN [Dyella sp. M7H15-1]|uniref:L-threonylcarbamoyladenylate synthase n=1 Tax=Dyella sp. M7H15-1 TaxID=2501295 RepID=UPI001004E528|nr:Sua5/YciO/YrdC/YwlC family protein [Dyella sp. M7H15-1]QAU24698.1 tRNA threonylcarbamoyladenosine biosynthesis protein RimN [Dyella sp. M7H15-1]